MKHFIAAILCHNYKLTSEKYLLGSDECETPVPCCFFHLPISILLHAGKPHRCVKFSNQDFPLAVYLDATTSILKCLHYSRGIGQVKIECKIQAICTLKWTWQNSYIHGLMDGSHFVFLFSVLFWQPK